MAPIYRALADLRERGWITSRQVPSAKGPEAKVYELTLEGRRALQEWAASDYEPAVRFAAPDFRVRLHFAGQFGLEHTLRIVRTELAYRREQRAHEDELAYETLSGEMIPELDPTWVRMIDTISRARGWETGSNLIAWLEALERSLLRWRDLDSGQVSPWSTPLE